MLRTLLRDETKQFRVVEDPTAISDIVEHGERLLWLDLENPTAAELALVEEEFNLHPLAMMFGYVTLAGNSITMKKVGGLVRTQIHGYLMFAMSACACFGAYVMWTNKEAAKKPHYTTTHSYIGGAALMLTVLYPVFAWVLYNPVTGI